MHLAAAGTVDATVPMNTRAPKPASNVALMANDFMCPPISVGVRRSSPIDAAETSLCEGIHTLLIYWPTETEPSDCIARGWHPKIGHLHGTKGHATWQQNCDILQRPSQCPNPGAGRRQIGTPAPRSRRSQP